MFIATWFTMDKIWKEPKCLLIDNWIKRWYKEWSGQWPAKQDAQVLWWLLGYLSHDSPSVRKIHCSGRKWKENVKDYQKWMEEYAQSLTDKTTAVQQGRMPPTPFSAPPPAWAAAPPPPSLPALLTLGWGQHPIWGPSMMPVMGPPPPGMMPVAPAPGMGPPTRGHTPMMPGPPVMRRPTHPMMAPTWPGTPGPDR